MINLNNPNIYHQDQQLMGKINGWIRVAQAQKPGHSNFLSLSQLSLTIKMLAYYQINFHINNVFSNALRSTISINNDVNNIQLLVAQLPLLSRITHGKFMGYLLNQAQIKFKMIGDIYLTPKAIYVTVIKKNCQNNVRQSN